MTNVTDDLPLRYVDQAFRLLMPAVTRAVAPPGGSKVADASWQQYVGRYTGRFSDIEIQLLNGELVIINPTDDNPWESRIILEPAGSHAFRMVARGFTYADIGEILTLEMDPTGKVARVSTPYFYWLPIQ